MINYKEKICGISIVKLKALSDFNKNNCVQSLKFKLKPILHSNCDFYYLCTKYTHFEYVMQPVEAS